VFHILDQVLDGKTGRMVGVYKHIGQADVLWYAWEPPPTFARLIVFVVLSIPGIPLAMT